MQAVGKLQDGELQDFGELALNRPSIVTIPIGSWALFKIRIPKVRTLQIEMFSMPFTIPMDILG